MKTRFSFSVAGDPDVREAVLHTVGAVIGYTFKHRESGMGEVLVDNTNFWFMKGILERLESKKLISGISWGLDNSQEELA